MNKTNQTVEKQIEISIDQARSVIERKNTAMKMIESPAFKEIIEEGYFREEAARLVGLMADPEFASEDKQEEIRNDMMGISALRFYIVNLLRMGSQMEQSLAASEEALDELREEEAKQGK